MGAFGILASEYFGRFAGAFSKDSSFFPYRIHNMPTIVIIINDVVKIFLYMILVPIWASQPLEDLGLTIITRTFDSHVSLKVLDQKLEPCTDTTCRNPC